MALNRQKVYDTVKAHLLKQGRKAMRKVDQWGTEKCSYRGDDDTKCAVGVLIPDTNYHPVLEGLLAYDHAVLDAIGSDFFSDTKEYPPSMRYSDGDQNFLRRLQNVHDGFNPALWEAALESVATDYKLTP